MHRAPGMFRLACLVICHLLLPWGVESKIKSLRDAIIFTTVINTGASNTSMHKEFSLQNVMQSFFTLRLSSLLGHLKEV